MGLSSVSIETTGTRKERLLTCPLKSLVLAGILALQMLLDSQVETLESAVAIALANNVIDLVKKNMPMIQNKSYKATIGCPMNTYKSQYMSTPKDCSDCDELRAWLTSPNEEVVLDKKMYDSHLEARLQGAGLLERLSVQSSGDSNQVVVKKTYESPLFKKAQQEIANLKSVMAELVLVAVVSGLASGHPCAPERRRPLHQLCVHPTCISFV